MKRNHLLTEKDWPNMENAAPYAGRNIDKSTVITLERGKIPPQAVDLEEAVLGAMLIDSKGVDDCFDVIKSGDVFYKDAHRFIYEAIKSLSEASQPIDLLTVSQRLKLKGKLESAGGDGYLVKLTQKVASSAHVDFHSRIILQKYMMRQLIKLGNAAVELGYDDQVDVFDALDEVGRSLDAVNDIVQKGSVSATWEEAVMAVPKRVERLTNNQGALTGIDCGLDNFNKHFGGWQPTDLIVIGADSGMGKTALAMTHILAAAKRGHAVGMVSMEMSTMQLAIRGTSVESDFHMKQLTQTGFEKIKYFSSLNKVVHSLKDLPIYVDDRPSLTVPEMKRKARQMKRKHNIQLFIADFIQMFTGDEDDIKLTGIAARELKNLAKELNIPVIALSQLNREVKKAKYCIPSKHHLKNSSGVEEAADVILLLYRPEYYGYKRIEYPQLYEDLMLMQDENAVAIVAKNRNGGLGDIPMCYVENKTKYVNPGEVIYVDQNYKQVGDPKTVFDAE